MSNDTFNYKNYNGSVETSTKDMVVHGRILFINDLVTYEAGNLPDLKSEFELAVDEYLADCEQDGLEPNKPMVGSFNVRVGEDLHRKVCLLAHKKGITLNKAVIEAVSQYTEMMEESERVAHRHVMTAQTVVRAVTRKPTVSVVQQEAVG